MKCPAREDLYCRVALERPRQHLGAFDAKIAPAVFNLRDDGLRNARQLGKLRLATAVSAGAA